MKRRPATGIGTLVTLAALLISGFALGGQEGVRFDRPRVWEGAAVNTVVLPYVHARRTDRDLKETAKNLTLLVHVDALFSMLKYDRVGATTLTTRGVDAETIERELNAEAVMAKILGRRAGAENEVRDGHGVVLLWGYVYEEGDDVYVQSYIWFVRRDVQDQITLTVANEDMEPIELVGLLPPAAFAFAPRKLSRSDLKAIGDAFDSSARIHEEPDESSPSHPVVRDPDVPFAYWVTDSRQGWMRIKSPHNEVEGWVKADPDLGGLSLDRKMPELDFAEAAVGYLRYRMAADATARVEDPEQIREWTISALRRYEQNTRGNRAPAPAAMADIMRGTMSIVDSRGASTIAARQYAGAVKLIPHSAEARNLDAITRAAVAAARQWRDESPAEISTAMLRALALDPGNEHILANLEGFYTAIESLSPSVTQIEYDVLREKLDAVRRVRASIP